MKYNKKVLNNGLRIITVPMSGSETAIATVLVEAGSDYEDKKNNGISHFLEHMCFKGTKNRTGKEINIELDSLGATSNAFTGNELTGYWAKGQYKKLPKIIEVISDMYLNPTFPENDIKIEKGVILEEINMFEDLPQRKVWDIFYSNLFPNQPHGRNTLGPKENIKKFERKDFVEYYEKHYVPNKTVVVVAGNINEKEVISLIKDKFGKIKKSEHLKKIKPKNNQKDPNASIFYKKSDQSHIVIGFRSFDLYDPRAYALNIAATILGKGMSSRLFQKMRDELGMCYYVGCSNILFTDHGILTAVAGVGNDRVEEAVSVFIDEFKKIRDDKISEEEIKKAKDILLGKMATNLETSDDWAEYFGEQELYHEKIVTPKDEEKKIRAVTEKDIKKVLKQVIKNKNLNLAIIGPHKDNKKFQKILKV